MYAEVQQQYQPPSYVQRHLLPSERLVIAVRQHFARIVVPVAITIAALLIAFTIDIAANKPNQGATRDAVWVVWFLVFLWGLWRTALWWQDYFIVTNKRIMLTRGVFTKTVNMMPLTKVTDMSYRKPFLGRVLGYGVFVMESAGQDQALREIDYVPDADAIYLEICDLIFGAPPSDD